MEPPTWVGESLTPGKAGRSGDLLEAWRYTYEPHGIVLLFGIITAKLSFFTVFLGVGLWGIPGHIAAEFRRTRRNQGTESGGSTIVQDPPHPHPYNVCLCVRIYIYITYGRTNAHIYKSTHTHTCRERERKRVTR